MIHKSLPQTYTPERLAEWITQNKIETKLHSEDFELTEDEIKEYEHKSSLASRSIDKLKDVQDYVKKLLKKGTPFDIVTGQYTPVAVTVPPTQGLDILEANREFADLQIERGVRTETVEIYLIPYPEKSEIIGVDIEGKEWIKYSRIMTKDEIGQYKPLLKKYKNVEDEEFDPDEL